jgi:hypothetical protein
MKKFTAVLFMFVMFVWMAIPADAKTSPAIDFDFEPEAASPLSADILLRPSYPALDAAKYGASAGKYLLGEAAVTLTSGDGYRVLLTAASLGKDGSCSGIQLIIADERKTPAATVQRVKLGDGYAPAIIFAPGGGTAMFKTIRAGDNTEARVYSVNPVTGRFDEKLAVTRQFPERMKLEISCVMKPGGIMEIESKNPAARETLDMSGALEALTEDELYQPDGNPVKALTNLKLVRAGWEDEDIYVEGGETRIAVGMSLITLSKKTVIDVTAALRENDGVWVVSELRFEPSLPYRTE